jgi:3-oxoacyl-[acyl-carrier protein] reductase
MKKVLITGSGRRIGKELVKLFEKKSWDVIIHYNSSEESAKELFDQVKKTGTNCYIFKADLTDEKEVSSQFQKCFEEFGVPDVLINNAGVFPSKTKLENITSDEINNVFALNTFSIIYTSKIFSKYAKVNSKIINIISIGGVQIWENRLLYNISKSAALQLNKSLARELAPDISVNAINPGFIVLEEENGIDLKPISLEKIPMNRYGNINDIFEAVFFFANSSSYLTGQYLNIDGGYTDCF